MNAFGSVDSDHNLDASPLGVKATSSTSSPPTSRNRKFYFEDDMTIFIVENELFRVHRYFLTRESEFFHTMLSCPPGSEGPEGISDDKAIPYWCWSNPGRALNACLTTFTINGMCNQLSRAGTNAELMYSGRRLSRHQTNQYWINILTFCNRFDLDNVRDVAMSHLDSYPEFDPIDAIAIAERIDMRRWLLPAFKTLCQRVEPLNLSEGNKIGMEKALLIARAREAVRDSVGAPSPPRSYYSSRAATPEPLLPSAPFQPTRLLYSDSLVTRVVKEVFGDDLNV
ncbi:hypothetical protein F5146DRAFT_1135071 [Armillaria mellea]|nr:hypothetical protein F5146DRAFT_1135071 [Armillaria mellea]